MYVSIKMERFSSIIKYLPLQYKDFKPEDKYVLVNNNPPSVEIEFFDNQKNIKNINCFSNEGDNWGNPNISVTDVQVGGSTTITGNLTVKGTQSIINSQSLEVRDKTVGIGSTASPTDATANGAGIVVYGATPKNFTWGSSGTKWTLTGGGIDLVDATVAGVTTSGSYVGRHTNIPKNAKTGAYVLVAADAGQTISNTTGGVTVNNNVFAAGDAVTIYNDSGSNQTITQGTGVTLRKAGSATTGNLTLKGYGLVTIWFKLTSEAIASGNLA